MLAACAVMLAGLSTGTIAGISDFYITDASGLVYEVDGATLAATEVVQLNNAFAIHEIMYMGNNQLMYNVFGRLSIANLVTGETEVVFDIHDHLGSGIHYGNGLARTQSGDIFMTVRSQGAGFPLRDYGVLVNIENQTFTELADLSRREFYIDHHQVAENLFLSADWASGTIHTMNADTGVILSETSFGFYPVSFFEADGSVYVIAKEGGLYTYDYLTNSVDYLGDVTGAGTNIIGATIPASGTLSLLGLASIVATRRRR